MKYEEIDGDIIELAKSGEYDVVIHGCNCFSTQGKGLAPQMNAAFNTLSFQMEQLSRYNLNEDARYNKLGCIDYEFFGAYQIYVVNCYTQFHPGKAARYNALTLCLSKLNFIFKGKKILVPAIGAGLGGLDIKVVKTLIKVQLKDMDVTFVNYVI